jgi:hypothetical protein
MWKSDLKTRSKVSTVIPMSVNRFSLLYNLESVEQSKEQRWVNTRQNRKKKCVKKT